MKDGREYVDYLQDILDTIVKAEQFIEGMDFGSFCADDKTVFAVVRALEIVGEATKKIPDEVRDNYPNLPWREMAGLRDKLAHDYFGVNLDVVWKTVTDDLPKLKSGVSSVVEAESRE
jgi:uncharacterized protein with HEPN domain